MQILLSIKENVLFVRFWLLPAWNLEISSPFAFAWELYFILAVGAIASCCTNSLSAMTLTIVFKAVTFLAIAFQFLSTFTWARKLYHFNLFSMFLCDHTILASNTRAVISTYLSDFEAVTVLFQAVGFLATTAFTCFYRCCQFSYRILWFLHRLLFFFWSVLVENNKLVIFLRRHFRGVRLLFRHLLRRDLIG